MADSQTQTIKKCNTCQLIQQDLLRCSKCKAVYYCGPPCQKQDWPSHKLICNDNNDNNDKNENEKKENENEKKEKEPLAKK